MSETETLRTALLDRADFTEKQLLFLDADNLHEFARAEVMLLRQVATHLSEIQSSISKAEVERLTEALREEREVVREAVREFAAYAEDVSSKTVTEESIDGFTEGFRQEVRARTALAAAQTEGNDG